MKRKVIVFVVALFLLVFMIGGVFSETNLIQYENMITNAQNNSVKSLNIQSANNNIATFENFLAPKSNGDIVLYQGLVDYQIDLDEVDYYYFYIHKFHLVLYDSYAQSTAIDYPDDLIVEYGGKNYTGIFSGTYQLSKDAFDNDRTLTLIGQFNLVNNDNNEINQITINLKSKIRLIYNSNQPDLPMEYYHIDSSNSDSRGNGLYENIQPQQGPQGPKGDTGPVGPQGPPGNNSNVNLTSINNNISSLNQKVTLLQSWQQTVNNTISTIQNSITSILNTLTGYNTRITKLEGQTPQGNATSFPNYCKYLNSGERKDMVCGYATDNNLTQWQDCGLSCNITYKTNSRGRTTSSCKCK